MQEKRVALVTGANYGVGLQVAKELVRHGFVVVVGSRDLKRGETAAEEVGPGATAVQFDVNDQASIGAAAERIRRVFGHPDVLVQNAAISNTNRQPDESIAEHSKKTRPSNVPLEDMRKVWDTNVFGVLAVHQAMLPLLRATPGSRIVIVSSGAGSLTRNADKGNQHQSIFGPVYPASKTALNALALAMAIELEPEGIPVSIVSPGFVSTNLNGFAGTQSLEEGAREIVRVALLSDGVTATFTRWPGEAIPW